MEQTGAKPAAVSAAPITQGTEEIRTKTKSKRSRSKSAYVRPRADTTFAAPAVTFRRPYSAYTKRDGEAENTPKYDDERTNREWWRYYVKVNKLAVAWGCKCEWAFRLAGGVVCCVWIVG